MTNLSRCRASRLTISPNKANIQDLMSNKAAKATKHTPHSTSRANILLKAVLDTASLPSNSSIHEMAVARAPRTMVALPHTSKDSLVLLDRRVTGASGRRC